MCNSLHNVKSRPANIGDKLATHDFGMAGEVSSIGGCKMTVSLSPLFPSMITAALRRPAKGG